MINGLAVSTGMMHFTHGSPFDHAVIDGFLRPDVLLRIQEEWPQDDDPRWITYHNALEDKKTCNKWDAFGPFTYQFFSKMCSLDVTRYFSACVGVDLVPDYGLHGGGLHQHGEGGKNGAHLDYSIHPKMGLQRKLNIILYIAKPGLGGHFGLWADPDKLVKEVEPRVNRAVVFDTTQNSWHGLSRTVHTNGMNYRKSLAMYYLCEPPPDAPQNRRVLFGLTQEQKNDAMLQEFVAKRCGVDTAKEVYRDRL
jgi:hypothetical protein